MAGGEEVHVAYWSRPDFPLPDYFSSPCTRVRAAWGQYSLCGLDQSSSSESNYSFHFVWGLPAAGRRWSSEQLCRTTWRSSLQLESYWHWVEEPGVASGAPCCGWWHWCLIWGCGAPPAPYACPKLQLEEGSCSQVGTVLGFLAERASETVLGKGKPVLQRDVFCQRCEWIVLRVRSFNAGLIHCRGIWKSPAWVDWQLFIPGAKIWISNVCEAFCPFLGEDVLFNQ